MRRPGPARVLGQQGGPGIRALPLESLPLTTDAPQLTETGDSVGVMPVGVNRRWEGPFQERLGLSLEKGVYVSSVGAQPNAKRA